MGPLPTDGSASVIAAFKPGDVLRYVPHPRHCREATAYVCENGTVVDTFWHTFEHDGAVLRDSETATAEVVFNVADYDALDRYAPGSRLKWETYNVKDRGRISSQHGHQELLFIRRGARPDLVTQIANARAVVDVAEQKLRSAESHLRWSREDLAKLEAEADS